MIYASNEAWEIRYGSAEDCLAEMPERSVRTIVTSPPYYDVRDYGTAIWQAGDPDCAHGVPEQRSQPKTRSSTIQGTMVNQRDGAVYRAVCGLCGARRSDRQVGIEEKQSDYVKRLVEIFEAARRPLLPEGTLWLNLGETYVNGEPSGAPFQIVDGLKAAGWKHRATVIWDKPNAMPESVKSRPASSFEYLFFMAAGPGHYYRHRGKLNVRSVWRGMTAQYKGSHVAVMPLWLAQRCVILSTSSGETVLDPFMGSGTSLLAAGSYRRRGVGIDLSLPNCGLAARRLAGERIAELELV